MKYRVYMKTEKSRMPDHKVNEDRYLFSEYAFMKDPEIRLLIVADGMGGLEEGEKAARNAVMGFSAAFYNTLAALYTERWEQGFSASYFAEHMQAAVKSAIVYANQEVCSHVGALQETGTTLSVVCIADQYAVVANIGDSPVYYYQRETGQLRLVSELQTQAEQDVENGQYERYSAEYYANDHRLYQSLGQYSELNPDDIACCVIGRLQAGDMFLAGSDGAFGRLREFEIAELLDGSGREEEAFLIPQLFELARMDKNDDQTAILYITEDEEDLGSGI